MNWSWTKISVVCFIGALAVVVYAVLSYKVSVDQYQESLERYDQTARRIQDYQDLMRTKQDTLYGSKPLQDIEAKVNQVLQLAAISPIPRFEVTVRADEPVQSHSSSHSRVSSSLREQEVLIKIPRLSVQQIGSFLVEWRAEQHLWKPNSIQLVHDSRSNSGLYTLHLSCIAIYHGNEG